ncbi:hypothetical protein CR513_31603, partial [Mucuna pruriens]
MKIDVHVKTLSMEFGDNLVQLNIFLEPSKDHSPFTINIMDELVEEHIQIGTGNVDESNFVETSNVVKYFYTMESKSLNFLMCNGVPECSRCVKFPITVTSKPVLTQVATLVNNESDSENRF